MKSFKQFIDEAKGLTGIKPHLNKFRSHLKKSKETSKNARDFSPQHDDDVTAQDYDDHDHNLRGGDHGEKARNLSRKIQNKYGEKGKQAVHGVTKSLRKSKQNDDVLKKREKESKQSLKKGDWSSSQQKYRKKDVAPGTTMRSGIRKGKLHPDLQKRTKLSLYKKDRY